MRSIVAPALMVSALALSPALVSADDSSGQNAEPSSESMTEQNSGQTGATQSDEGMSEDKTMESEDSSTEEMEPLETAGQRGDFITAQTPDQILSETYIGASVLIGSGEEMESVGTISQLIFDDSNAITGAVVDVGGFLGLGAKPVGLQWSALDEKRAEETVAFSTSLTREDFENAPEFKDLADQRSEENLEMQTEQPATTTGTTN